MLKAIREVLAREVPELGTMKIYRLSHAIHAVVKHHVLSLFSTKGQTRTHAIDNINHPPFHQPVPEHTVAFEDK